MLTPTNLDPSLGEPRLGFLLEPELLPVTLAVLIGVVGDPFGRFALLGVKRSFLYTL